jgi:hypothetical protein
MTLFAFDAASFSILRIAKRIHHVYLIYRRITVFRTSPGIQFFLSTAFVCYGSSKKRSDAFRPAYYGFHFLLQLKLSFGVTVMPCITRLGR